MAYYVLKSLKLWKKPLTTIACLAVLLFLIINIFFYLSIEIKESTNGTEKQQLTERNSSLKKKFYVLKNSKSIPPAIQFAHDRITKKLKQLNKSLIRPGQWSEDIYNQLNKELRSKEKLNITRAWEIVFNWLTPYSVLPENAMLLGSVLTTLCSSKIIKAENANRGTQLKLLLTLEGGQTALYKPQWYKRNETIVGPVYAGKDRHNAEVAAFHLSLLLNLRRVPLTVGRKINVRREILPVATASLNKTVLHVQNNICFYGSCMYCSVEDPICAANDDFMEGALISWLPDKFQFARHVSPWQRTYKNHIAARWEMDKDYCEHIKNTKQYSIKVAESRRRLLDLIDAAVFDFLIDNGDRHHYEVPLGIKSASVFLFDNGKSFGNPKEDHLDILAPLFQCCILRKSTWSRLKAFRDGTLGSVLNKTLMASHIFPVLSDEHLEAIDRRLTFIFAAVEGCFDDFGATTVLY